jgi:serine/threonine-protein kinase
MVMEYLEGKNLEELLLERGRLPIDEAVDYVLEALEAVAQAHAIGIVHRDLKPANLFLAQRRDGSERIKILDFGISKANERAASPRLLTSPNTMLGSPQYMSPEQAKTPTDVDLRTDIWSLGVILHELIAGFPPFEGDTPALMLVSIASKPPIPLRAKRPDAPAELEAVIARCLEQDRDKRYANAAELAQALAPFGSELTRGLPARIAQVLAPGPRLGIRDTGARSLGASGEAFAASKGAERPKGDGAQERRTPEAEGAKASAPRPKSKRLVFVLIGVVLVGLGMIASAAWRAVKEAEVGDDGAAPSASQASSVAPVKTAGPGKTPAPRSSAPPP